MSKQKTSILLKYYQNHLDKTIIFVPIYRVCVCIYDVHLFVDTCFTCVWACGGLRLMAGIILNLPCILFIEAGSFSQTQSSLAS